MDEAGTSAADRRRAARQRKILDNAQSRMDRLYGRPDSDQSRAPQQDQTNGELTDPTCPTPGSGHCPDPPDQSIDEVLGRSLPLLRGRAAAGMAAPNMEDLFRQLNNGRPVEAGGLGGGSAAHSDDSGGGGGGHPSAAWRRWDRYRWLVVALLAVLTRLATLAGVGAAMTQNVLVPFFVLEVTVYITRLLFVPLRTNMGLLGTALALCGIPPRTLDLWGRYITFLSHAWNDFMVYMFVIVFSFRFGGDVTATASSGKERADAASPSPSPSPSSPPPPPVYDHLDYEF